MTEESMYKVMKSRTISGLEEYVNELMQEGWAPVGEVSISTIPSSFLYNDGSPKNTYHQAMIKNGEQKENK